VEVEYSASRILKELEEATRAKGKWIVEREGVEVLEKREKEAIAKSDWMEAYEAFVLRMNLGGTPAGRFEDGLVWNEGGEYGIQRRALGEIVRSIVEKDD